MQDISIFHKSNQNRASTQMGGIKQVNALEVKRYFDDTYGSPPKPYSALSIIQNDHLADYKPSRTPNLDYDSHKYSTS